jgi:hypothetical protein
VADEGKTLGTLAPVEGLYTSTSLLPWTPLSTLSVSAGGAAFAAFSLQVEGPGTLPNVEGPPLSQGVARLSLGSDVSVQWTPASGAELFTVSLSQSTGEETCYVSNGSLVSLATPLFVTCSVPNAAGTLTIPKSFLLGASFSVGARGQLSYASENVAQRTLQAPHKSPSTTDSIFVVAEAPYGSPTMVEFVR